ncbi:hypothetical protein [Roseateles oligotrophus]|uniref:Uncharacterized protein n=1 Tax=Roseateles oligotrophus TaxID=1769250 RepID=A0ABT2YLE2_9BURK|nr:hypothetical protein [Roseateles oligotrophus]MCV2370756.1 hypothetical protein [Roseateles oligotrophus]
MTRLQSELQRLYGPPATAPTGHGLIDIADAVRLVVLELARPADWTLISKVWRGVQADLALPAPAIAVSGVDGYLLCFSFAEPQPRLQAQAFAEALRLRYLDDVARKRIGICSPSSAALPPRQTDQPQDLWSAFVAPDLAPVFAAEPWLDIPPSHEGQADLLCRLDSIKPAALQLALQRLGAPTLAPAPSVNEPAPAQLTQAAGSAAPSLDPRSFLLKVMNDESVAMALRIEAAKALLP